MELIFLFASHFHCVRHLTLLPCRTDVEILLLNLHTGPVLRKLKETVRWHVQIQVQYVLYRCQQSIWFQALVTWEYANEVFERLITVVATADWECQLFRFWNITCFITYNRKEIVWTNVHLAFNTINLSCSLRISWEKYWFSLIRKCNPVLSFALSLLNWKIFDSPSWCCSLSSQMLPLLMLIVYLANHIRLLSFRFF
jgi:hypothetical protein